MRLHVVNLPHTQTTEAYLTCAYTQKLVRFGKMMRPLGYEVFIYGGTENTAECDRFITVVTDEQRIKWFGEHDANAFYPITWDPTDDHWRIMNMDASRAILENRESERDLVLLIGGNCQQAIAEALPEMTSCEWGIGYEGVFSDFCAYESASWMHYVYGRGGRIDGRWYDTVIPNFFDRDDFYVSAEPDDYLLFIGRLVRRKGPDIAAMVAERAGKRLLVVGQGAVHVEPGYIVAPEVTIEGDHVEYVGPVGREDRAVLYANALATLVPTQYIEPFGGVAVESMLSGTPVISTAWGAFSGSVIPGVTGYHFGTLQEGADAVDRVGEIDPTALREHALERYSLEAVGPMYDRWFRQLDGLWGEGWPA